MNKCKFVTIILLVAMIGTICVALPQTGRAQTQVTAYEYTAADKNAFVTSQYPNGNYGGGAMGWFAGNATYLYAYYFHFPDTSPPTGYVSLELLIPYISAVPFTAALYYRTDISWGETTLTYNNQPGGSWTLLATPSIIEVPAESDYLNITRDISGFSGEVGRYTFCINTSTPDIFGYMYGAQRGCAPTLKVVKLCWTYTYTPAVNVQTPLIPGYDLPLLVLSSIGILYLVGKRNRVQILE